MAWVQMIDLLHVQMRELYALSELEGWIGARHDGFFAVVRKCIIAVMHHTLQVEKKREKTFRSTYIFFNQVYPGSNKIGDQPSMI